MGVYAYRGDARLIDAVASRLEAAGWQREGEAELADVVITFFNTMGDLEDLCFGDDGLVQVMRPGAVLMDLSPVSPNFARELNAIATLSDLRFVEAPLMVRDMVAPEAFARENMTCFAAGEDGCIEEVSDVLDALFSDVQVMAGGGAAQLARAAVTIQAVAEAVAAIEARALVDVSRKSLAGMEMGQVRAMPANPVAQAMLQAVDAGRFDGAFTCEMLMGELSAALMAADDNELIIPQAESAMHLLELLAVIGGAEKSPAALALVYGDEAASADNGLDWERAEQLYGHEGHDHADGFDDGYDYDDAFGDDYFDDDGAGEMGFGYSVN